MRKAIKQLLLNKARVREAVEMVKYIDSNIEGRVPNREMYILYLIKQLLGEKCKTYLEIGSLHGSSLSLMMQDPTKTRFVAVDLGRVYTDPFGKDVSPEILKRNVNKFNIHNHDFDIIFGDSKDKKVIELCKSKVKYGVDLFFIDGDHSPDGVRNDFYSYIDIVNPGGVIVFDDYDFNKGVKSGLDSILKEIDEKDFQLVGSFMNPGYYKEYPTSLKLSRTNRNAEYIMIKR